MSSSSPPPPPPSSSWSSSSRLDDPRVRCGRGLRPRSFPRRPWLLLLTTSGLAPCFLLSIGALDYTETEQQPGRGGRAEWFSQ